MPFLWVIWIAGISFANVTDGVSPIHILGTIVFSGATKWSLVLMGPLWYDVVQTSIKLVNIICLTMCTSRHIQHLQSVHAFRIINNREMTDNHHKCFTQTAVNFCMPATPDRERDTQINVLYFKSRTYGYLRIFPRAMYKMCVLFQRMDCPFSNFNGAIENFKGINNSILHFFLGMWLLILIGTKVNSY